MIMPLPLMCVDAQRPHVTNILLVQAALKDLAHVTGTSISPIIPCAVPLYPFLSRRSQSPPPRTASAAYDPAYPGGAGGPPYSGGFSGSNGYSGPPRNAGGARDYPARPPREAGEPGYRR